MIFNSFIPLQQQKNNRLEMGFCIYLGVTSNYFLDKTFKSDLTVKHQKKMPVEICKMLVISHKMDLTANTIKNIF